MRHSFTRLALGLAVGVALMSGAMSVHAAGLTSAQVSAIINLLQSFGADSATITQVSQVLGGTSGTATTPTTSTVSCVDVTRTLTVDSQGSDVTSLQSYLIAKGYLASGNATGYYGPLTAQAVGKLQIALGIIASSNDSAYGILGPKTRAAIACTPQATSDTPAPTQTQTLVAPTQTTTPTPTAAPTTSGAPVITQFSVSPQSATKWSSATISWASTNTSSCTVTRATGDNYNIDMTQASYNSGTGLYSVSTGRLGQTGTYLLSCVSPSGATVTSTAGVTVTDPTVYAPIPDPAINSFTASPATVTGGSTSALAWSVSYALGCTVTPTAGDMRPVTYTGVGASAVTPAITQTTTYQLKCLAYAGSTSGPVSRNVTVNYQAPATQTPAPTQTVPNPSISSFTASPTTVVGGSAAALAWSASNVSSCTVSPISGDMRAVTYTGSASATTPAITQSTTYQLTCTALAGATGGAATRTVTVNYQAPVTQTSTPTTPTQGAATITISKPAPNTVYTMKSGVTAVIDYTNATFPSQAYVRFDLLKASVATTKNPSNSYTTQQFPSANGTNTGATFPTGVFPYTEVPGTYIINAELRKCNPAGCMNNTQAEWSAAPYATATPVIIELR